jgi:hypothetical protein
MSVIDPRGLTVIEWCDFMTDELTGFSQPPRLDSAEEWQFWALTVCQSPRIAGFNPPNPLEYQDWLVWAERFNQVVDLPT